MAAQDGDLVPHNTMRELSSVIANYDPHLSDGSVEDDSVPTSRKDQWTYLCHQRASKVEKLVHLGSLQGHRAKVSCIAITMDNQILTGSEDSSLKLWDVSSGEAEYTYNGHLGAVTCLAVNDFQFVSGGIDKALLLWDLPQRKEVREKMKSNRLWAHSYDILSTRPSTVVKAGNQPLVVGDPRTFNMRYTGHSGPILCTCFSDEFLVSGSEDGTVRLWSLEEQKCQSVISMSTSSTARGATLAVLDVKLLGNLMITACADSIIRIWALPSGNLKMICTGHKGEVLSLDLVDPFLVSGGVDGRAVLWSLPNEGGLAQVRNVVERKPSKILSCDCDSASCIAFDGTYAIVGGYDASTRLWNAKDGSNLSSAVYHTSNVSGIAIKGCAVASCSWDHSIKIMQLVCETGEPEDAKGDDKVNS